MLWKIRVSCSESCPTLRASIDCSPQAPLVHGILQTRILKQIAIPFSRGASQPGMNAGLPHCRWVLYHLSHQESPLEDTYLAASLASTNWMLKYPPAGASRVAQLLKNLPCNARDERDTGSKPGSGRSPGEGDGNPLQYSCL